MKKIRIWVALYKWLMLYYVSLLFMDKFTTIIDTHNNLTQFIVQIICLIIIALSEYQERYL